jgi:hypothetical protein
MKFNTEITVVQPATGERTKWQGPQIEADTIQEAEKAAFASIMYVSGENVPREQLSVSMQPPRSLSAVIGINECKHQEAVLHKILVFLLCDLENLEYDKKICNEILRAIEYKVFNPLDPEVIRMKNEKLFHPNFISKLDEAESIGGVVISYLPEV